MFTDLGNLFIEFLQNFLDNTWCYTYLGIFIFIILVYILCSMLKNRR